MNSWFRFNAFEVTVAFISLITTLISGIILLSGTTLSTMPNFSEAIPPSVFETEYVMPGSEIAPQATPLATQTIQPTPIQVASPSATVDSTTEPAVAPEISPYASVAPSKYEKVYLLYPASQAVLTNTRIDEGKGYQMKIRFEVDPVNTPCRLELKMGEELILSKELPGSPTGLYEVSVSLKKPALYKWRVFTQSSQSGERLFTIRK